MTIARARIIKADAGADADANAGSVTRTAIGLGRRIPAVVVDAHAEAARILGDARAKAEAMVAAAAAEAGAVGEAAAREARETELARVAAELIVSRAGEERRAERDVGRTIEIAALLAERLIGEAIASDPARVGALAIDALKETRGARQIRIEACVDDVAILNELLASLGEGVATIEASEELARGSLIVHTELGRIDARLAPQLARLAEALREALRKPE